MKAKLTVWTDEGQEINADFNLTEGSDPVTIELTHEGVKIHSTDEPKVVVE